MPDHDTRHKEGQEEIDPCSTCQTHAAFVDDRICQGCDFRKDKSTGSIKDLLDNSDTIILLPNK